MTAIRRQARIGAGLTALGLAALVLAAACGSAPGPSASAGPSVPPAPVAPASSPTAASSPAAASPSAPSPWESATPGGPPTGLITLPDGRHLDLTCIGSGGPIVVLEAGLGNASEVWTPLTFRVQSFATVCRYDRAGIGRSDPGLGPRGAAATVADLHALLGAAGLPPPYVMVGASYGGLATQLFVRTYPQEIAGVVLVDAIHPRWNAELEALLTPAEVAERHATPNGEPITNEELRDSDAAVKAAPPFPAVKLVVLRHSQPFYGDAAWPTEQVEALWAELQADLGTLSPESVVIQAPNAGHRIHQDQPVLVADAIHAIVDPALWPPK